MNKKAILAAIFGNAIWGFSFIFTKMALKTEGATVETFLANRFLVATIVMIIFILCRRQKVSLKGKRVGLLLCLAACSMLYFYFETWAIEYTNATFTGVVLSIVPIFAIGTGFLFLHEKPPLIQALLCLVPIAGVVIITLAGSEMGVVTTIGIVFVALTCIVSSFFKTFNRMISKEFTAAERNLASVALQCVVFNIVALCKNGFSVGELFANMTTPGYIIPLLTLVISSSVIANLLVNYSAGYMSVMQLATFGAVSTLCSAIGGVLFIDEPISILSGIGSILIIIGVYLVTKTGKTEELATK